VVEALLYSEKIDDFLQDLLPEEKKQVLDYIDQLSKDKTLSNG
jgi:hypothetical protein